MSWQLTTVLTVMIISISILAGWALSLAAMNARHQAELDHRFPRKDVDDGTAAE